MIDPSEPPKPQRGIRISHDWNPFLRPQGQPQATGCPFSQDLALIRPGRGHSLGTEVLISAPKVPYSAHIREAQARSSVCTEWNILVGPDPKRSTYVRRCGIYTDTKLVGDDTSCAGQVRISGCIMDQVRDIRCAPRIDVGRQKHNALPATLVMEQVLASNETCSQRAYIPSAPRL